MYFTVKQGSFDEKTGYEVNSQYEVTKNYLDNFSEVEKIEENGYHVYYQLPIKNLRKLRILSLSDPECRSKCAELEKVLNNSKLIHNYGDSKPKFESMSTGTSGFAGYTGSSGISGSSGLKPIKIVPNRFMEKVSKKFDFHKVSNKKFK